MLTDTDIHYLIGLLTRVKEADDVLIELGDMVLDATTGKKRDVDITAYYTDKDGIKSAYKGIEVKKHTRRLNVEHVEQLCMKFADMPEITHKGIVSASGYTDGAVSKAKAHDVELFEIVDWPDPGQGFNVHFTSDAFKMIEPKWTDGPHCKINVAEENYEKIIPPIDHLEVCDSTGRLIPNAPNAGALCKTAYMTAADKATKKDDPTVKDGDKIAINTLVLFNDDPHIKLGSEIIGIESCSVAGTVTYTVHDKPILKVFRKYGNDKPIAGCLMVELSNQSLTGISVNNIDNKITALNIPYADRIKKKIRRHRL